MSEGFVVLAALSLYVMTVSQVWARWSDARMYAEHEGDSERLLTAQEKVGDAQASMVESNRRYAEAYKAVNDNISMLNKSMENHAEAHRLAPPPLLPPLPERLQ